MKIVHEFRDLGFESELIRNKINFKPDLISHSIPIFTKKGKSIFNFHYFRFRSSLSLYIGGKELLIKHDEVCSIDGTLQGEFKCSSEDGCLTQTIVKIICSKNSVDTLNNTTHKNTRFSDNERNSKQLKRRNTATQSMLEKEKVVFPISIFKESNTDEREDVHDKHHKAIKKKGFDIDTSF